MMCLITKVFDNTKCIEQPVLNYNAKYLANVKYRKRVETLVYSV